ncbi:MAG TPA: hypothetical protein VGJ29_12400 [Vicinamibacterales bacterium]
MQQTILEALADGPATQQTLAQSETEKASKHLRAWLKFGSSAFRPSIVEGLICYGPPRGVGSHAGSHRSLAGKAADGPVSLSAAKPVWESVSAEMTEVVIQPADSNAGQAPAIARRPWVMKKNISNRSRR